tara:strand:- start:381 stop:572 length:192 start_codon:yes stop_codon:yes gene_type:complete
MKDNNKIENIILDYCEGIEHLEFSKSDLPAMVAEIKEAVMHSFKMQMALESDIAGSSPAGSAN